MLCTDDERAELHRPVALQPLLSGSVDVAVRPDASIRRCSLDAPPQDAGDANEFITRSSAVVTGKT
jgi:hypothetical protein